MRDGACVCSCVCLCPSACVCVRDCVRVCLIDCDLVPTTAGRAHSASVSCTVPLAQGRPSPEGGGRLRGRPFRAPAAALLCALAPEVACLVRNGMELGDAVDRLFGRSNSKTAEGAVGLLTRGRIDRTAYYEQPVLLALVPFLSGTLF